MGKVINFRQAGKKIARIKRQMKVSAKRTEFGQKKLIHALVKTRKILKTHLDNHKVESSDSKDKGER